MEGLTVELRMRLSAADVHYGGNLVDGAHGLEIFGDIVTELAIHTDGDEGLFAGYEKVEFLAPMYGGDFVRARGTIARMGNTSRTVDLEIWKEIVARPDVTDSAADYLAEPVLVDAGTRHLRGQEGALARAAGRRLAGVSGDLVITVAPCGAETTREQAPGVPYTPGEIAAEARRAFDAGARMVHVHATMGRRHADSGRRTLHRDGGGDPRVGAGS